jgi:GrpB-like predicted nucleotidyltransferase (UPF0157 family)
VCPRGSLALRNHLALRDPLRAHPPDVVSLSYSSLKKETREAISAGYRPLVAGKTDFIMSILARYGF